jgi:hypothetical protein
MIEQQVLPHSRIILDLCGGTGSWSRPYREAGYDVRTYDVLDDVLGNRPDIVGDVRLIKYHTEEPIHGILCAPPCKYLSKVGARWWTKWGDERLLEGLSIVDACLRIVWAHKPAWWALENPAGRLKHYLGDPLWKFHPADYGDGHTKLTYLWGDFIPPAKRPWMGKVQTNWVNKFPDSKGRSSRRAMTPAGFANAFFVANP